MALIEKQDDDALADFTVSSFNACGATRDVYRIGDGPAVIVIAEVPGITPRVAAFARAVAADGMTAVVPHLFGTPGRAPSVPYSLQTLSFACVSREFAVFATGKTSPVTQWLRALARHEHDRCGGPGVGVVGMCLTGGFALAMMVDETVLAPVLSQPSLPIGAGRAKADLGISDDDLARVKERCATEDDLCVLGLRFTSDPLVPDQRFDRLRRELGNDFVAVEIDSSPGNEWGYPRQAHSVLTEHLGPDGDTPTRAAMAQVMELFRSRLLTVGDAS
jgi:dienelactone hydrolase